MKKLLAIIVIAIVYASTIIIFAGLTGCTRTHVEGPTFTLDRVSFLQKVDVPELEFQADGTARLSGYQNGGGAAITAAAVTAAVNAVR